MAFKAGNRARKKEAVADTVESVNVYNEGVIDEFHHVVGEFTHDICQNIRDRVNAAILLYRVESSEEDLRKELNDDKALEKTKDEKKNKKSYENTPYWDTLVNKIKNIENINESILPLLKHKSNYCFNPIIRKLFAGDITDLVTYPYPVKSRLKLEPDEKKLLIDINNFKCSFMEETMGNLYLTTKIILSNLKPVVIVDKIFVVYVIQDKLGFYTKRKFDIVEPEVWLLLKEISTEAESLECARKYVLAKVYIHEMMHRYFDMHPELPFKGYIKEIEEPMAELATIEFCKEFCNKHEEYSELVDVANKQIKDLKATDNYFYALGADLYELYDEEKRRSLIDIFRHVCMMLHEQNKEVKDYLNIVQNSNKIDAYQNGDQDATEQFCDLLLKC